MHEAERMSQFVQNLFEKAPAKQAGVGRVPDEIGAKPVFRSDPYRTAELSCAEDMGEDRKEQVDVGHSYYEDTCLPWFGE